MAQPPPAKGQAPKARAQAQDEDEGVSEQVSTEIFASYECKSIDRGIVHPGDIAEPASLSAISLPTNDYPIWESVGDEIVNTGKLSKLQLEGVRYACKKHLEILTSGERAGFFIGDGAGVGKGRQIAGIILDNFCRGRTRHVWLSSSTDLHADATRDLRDLGMQIPVINNCSALDAATKVGGLSSDFKEGVLFLTYSTLVSAGRGGGTRFQQVLDWVGGAAFDGCIVFDECHRAKNYVPGKEGQSTKVSAAVIELQRRLPQARCVYCSATGVSEVGHMAYLERMGLWGPGSAFADFEAFLGSMKNRGVSFLEMLAMEMKAEGKYCARGLSFRAAEFSMLPCTLAPDQVETYNAAAALWQEVRAALAEALELTAGGADVWRTFWAAQQRFFKLLCVSLKTPTVVAAAKEALAGGMAVVIGLQSTGEAAMDALGLQHGAACGWVSATKETLRKFLLQHFPTHRNPKATAAQQAAAQQREGEVTGATQHTTQHTTQHATQAAGAGREAAKGVVVQECVRRRQELIARADSLQLPPHFLDELIDALGGPESVAEMTGRSTRVVRVLGEPTYVQRAKSDSTDMESLNISEKDEFMAGRKLVAILSDAASTGISLHAVRGAGNTRRRMHLTIELPWSADKAIQQLGRTHRSNQVSGPVYRLVTTDAGGEARFAAAVARRLQSLGALTRGDRRAASGVDLSEQNFDTPLGRAALRNMYDAVVSGADNLPAGVSLRNICDNIDVDAAGVPELRAVQAESASQLSVEDTRTAVSAMHASMLRSVDLMGVGGNTPQYRQDTVAEDTASAGKPVKELGDVRRFLNRLLGLPIARQNLLFQYFAASLHAAIRRAKAEGRYSEGMSDLPSSNISRAGPPSTLWVDPHSNLRTLRHTLRIDRGVSFAEAQKQLALQGDAAEANGSGFYISQREIFGRRLVLLAAAKPGAGQMFNVCRPNTGISFFDVDRAELTQRYARASEEDAQAVWDELYESCLDACVHGPTCPSVGVCTQGRRITTVTILSGSVVRVWGVLELVLQRHEHSLSKADRAMRITRVDLQQHPQEGLLIGVRYKEGLLSEVVSMLNTIQATLKAQAAAGTRPAGPAAPYAHALEQHAAQFGGAAAAGTRREAVTPLQPKMRTRLFRKPKTLLSFFSRSPAVTAVTAPGARATSTAPPPASACGKGAAAAPVSALGKGVKRQSSGKAAAAVGVGMHAACWSAALGASAPQRPVEVVDLSEDTPVKVARVEPASLDCAVPAARGAVAAVGAGSGGGVLLCKDEPDAEPLCLPPPGAVGHAACCALAAAAAGVKLEVGEAGGAGREAAAADLHAADEGGCVEMMAAEDTAQPDAQGHVDLEVGTAAAADSGVQAEGSQDEGPGAAGCGSGQTAGLVRVERTAAEPGPNLHAVTSQLPERSAAGSVDGPRGQDGGREAGIPEAGVAVSCLGDGSAPVRPLAEKHENGIGAVPSGVAAALLRGARDVKGRVAGAGVSGVGARGAAEENAAAAGSAAERVLALGFGRTEVGIALKICRGNADRAIEYLLTR
eukprot:jgi/Ulvmu1/1336/UM011_0064.1